MTTRLLLLLCAFLSSTGISAQIPNGDFEAWTDGSPDMWLSNNVETLNLIPITQSTNAYSGSFAVKGEILPSFPGTDNLLFPVLISDQIPLSENPFAVNGWYILTAASPQMSLTVLVTLFDDQNGAVGFGGTSIPTTSTYTNFSVPIDYSYGSGGNAAYAQINFITNDDGIGEPTTGDFFIIDDLSFTTAVGIEELVEGSKTMSIPSIYPQPCAASCTIELTITEDQQITALAFDLLGNEVTEIYSARLPSGEHRLNWTPDSNLPNGMYLIQLRGEDELLTNRVIVER